MVLEGTVADPTANAARPFAFPRRTPMSASSSALFSPEMLADPYPTYHRLRSFAPVFWAEPLQAWVLTRYSDVSALLRDGVRFSSARTQSAVARIDDPRAVFLARSRED